MTKKDRKEKGGKARKESSKTENKKENNLGNNFSLIHVFYRDHLEYKNSNSITLYPPVREAIGWLSSENSEAICLCYDRLAKPFPNHKTRESGLLILKNDILEIIYIDFDNCFNCNRNFILGNNNP